ncbi:MAG: diguanylate cyclase [Desulfobacteraceae bacterium]|jgi:diguanylate cyclase (GGDEF)-like protein
MEKDGIDYSKESVLVVDDDKQFRETLVQLLSMLGFETGSASSGPGALAKLKENAYTFLLADMKMPNMDGLKLIDQVGQDFPDVSIIAMTGYAEGYKYIDVINAGASDFIKKPFQSDELEAKVSRIINERNLRKELSRLSITDSLTGLFNQRHFYNRLKEEFTRAHRQNHALSLILLDLDHFKAYNDTYGHLAGDEVLRNLGQIVNKSIREGVDSGYRYGGDEFAIILIDADLSIAKDIGKRIQKALEMGNFTASVGYATFVDGMSEKELVSEADKNLYKAKLKIKSNMSSS